MLAEGYLKRIEDCNDVKVLAEEIKIAMIPAGMKKDLMALLTKKKMGLVELEKKEFQSKLKELLEQVKGESAGAIVLSLEAQSVNASKLVGAVAKKNPGKSLLVLCVTPTSKYIRQEVLLKKCVHLDVSIGVSVCKNHLEKLDANKWFAAAATPCGGKGGGRNGNVAGTGSNVEGFKTAVVAAKDFIKSVDL